MANKKKELMQNIDTKFAKKFWSILGRLDRGTSTYYPNSKCARDIFARRVMRFFIKEGAYRFAVNGKFNISYIRPSYIRFGYCYRDKLFLEIFSIIKEDFEIISIEHNDSLRISWQEITAEKMSEISEICAGSLHEKFMNNYSSTKQYFEKDILAIKGHRVTRAIYKKLTGVIKDKTLKEVADIINATKYWDETGFYINQDNNIRKRMPKELAWFYLEDVKKILSELGYLKYKKEEYA